MADSDSGTSPETTSDELTTENPHADIDLDVSKIEGWYFVPYLDAPTYSPKNPLYSLIAVFKDFGTVMVYDRPGDAGAFHSVDISEIDGDIYPPSDAFQTALSTLLSTPGETHDITPLIAEMDPWEHHQLEILLIGLNDSPEQLPTEVFEFVNTMLDEKLTFDIDEEADTTQFGEIVSEEGEQFLDQLR